MARARNTSTGGSSRRGSLGTGIIIGALLGVCAALGIALYLNRGDVFIHEKPKSASPAVIPKVQGMSSDTAKSATESKTAKVEAKPRFDFYNILPGQEEPKVKKEAKPASAPRDQDVFFLQAGSFQNSVDADNLKARLALLGLEAQIQSATLPNNKVWHRVRVGPYASVEELNKAKIALKENHIDNNPLTVREPARSAN
jgi:cell division protein FtsN